MVLKFPFVDVTWQQTSKHLKKSISVATASIYRSQPLVLSGEERTKGKFQSYWFLPRGMWHCFN